MKEIKMFPQIMEETEENLLNLEEESKSPLSSSPPLNPSCSSTDSPTEAPSSPGYENQPPCPLPTITTEDVDSNSPSNSSPDNVFTTESELSMGPPKVRMRSLSGGAYRLAPSLPNPARTRRQSGDDVLTRVSPSRKTALIEHFRPRSKSDSKGKRPTFLTSLKNSIFSGGSHRKTSLEEDPLEPLQPGGDYRQRSRSGSETRGGTMSKMIDLFRNRSNSVSIDPARTRKLSLPSPMPSNALLRRHSVDPEKRRKAVNTFRSLDGPQESYSCHVDEDTGDNRIDYGSLDDDRIIPTYLSSQTCYNAMPKSGKVIILSTDLLVKNAFSCLVTNEIRAAPLWDSSTQTFVGILTITDFINVLRHYYYSSSEDIKDIENQQIQTWRKITNVRKPLVKAGPNSSLAEATKLLIQEGVHRLPIYDENRNSVLFVITRRRLLNYLYQNLMDKYVGKNIKSLGFFKKPICELNIGTYQDIATVTLETKVIEALDLFVERQVSSLPVVDEECKLINIFAKFDVFALAKEQTYHNLDITISEALDVAGVHEEVCTCALHESLESVIDRIVTYKVHRMVVVDEKHSVVGMISLSDILKFLVLQPLASLEEPLGITNETIEETPEGGSCPDGASKPVNSNSDLHLSNTPEESIASSNHLGSCHLSRDLDKLQISSEIDSPSDKYESANDLVDKFA